MSARTSKTPAWLREFVARYKPDIAHAIALGLVASGCAALLMFTSGFLISATALPETTLFSIMVPVACVQLFGFGRPLARYLERLASHNWVLRVTSDLRHALYLGIARKVNDPAHARSVGEYLGLLSDDVARLQNLYLRVVFPTVIAYLLALGASVLFGFFSIPFALVVAFSCAVVCVVVPYATLLLTKASSERAKALRADDYALLADDVYGALDWILAGRASSALSRLGASDARIRTLEASVRARRRIAALAATLILGALLVACVIWAGDSFGAARQSANWIAAFALGFFPLIEPFVALPAAVSEMPSHESAIARLNAVMPASDAPDDERGRTLEARSAIADEPAISIEHLAFTYPNAHAPALNDVNLSIRTGESVAVIGRSGSGKSTLADIICARMAPSEGSVSLLGESLETPFAHTSAPIDVSSVVGYLGQVPYLFNRSLRDNLTMGVLDAADDKLERALADVGLADRYATLPRGLDTVIGETGVGLSGGEAHRVALARILLADTPIVVLDEPFSALDPATEDALLDTMFTIFAERTLVIITHHLAQARRFDRIISLANGRIELDGTFNDLMDESEKFRTLIAAESQTSW